MTKITLIGGGSYSWGPTFLKDIFISPALSGSTICLHDINESRMASVYRLGQKMVNEFALDYHLKQTLSLDEALAGADFIILTISTGGLESMRHDLQIPLKYGIYQAVGDTTGPGGLSRALRNIPVVANIALKVEAICPQAFFLNYTNPLTVLTRTLTIFRSVPNHTVGLCHEWHGVRDRLAKLFGVLPNQVNAAIAGINHLPWALNMFVNGRSVWSDLRVLSEKITGGEIDLDPADVSVFSDHGKVKAELFQVFRALPAAGDRHIAEFFPHFINPSTDWGEKVGLRLTTIEDRQEMMDAAKALLESALRGEAPLAPFMQELSGEAVSPILSSVVTGERYLGIMNLPNNGQVANLSTGVVVETLGEVDATSVRGIEVGNLPTGIQTILEHHIHNQELTIQAALNGDRDLALQVLVNDPLSSRLTIDQCRSMLQELLEANRQWLPQFFTSPAQQGSGV